MFKKKMSYGPDADKLLATWPDSKKPKKTFDRKIDSATTIAYIIMLVVAPLVALTITFYNQRNERIDCSKLSSDSIQYLLQGGEELPTNCY